MKFHDTRPNSAFAAISRPRSQEMHITQLQRSNSRNFVCQPIETVDMRTQKAFELQFPQCVRQMLREAATCVRTHERPAPNTPVCGDVFYKHTRMRQPALPNANANEDLHLYIVPNTQAVIFNDFRFFSMTEFEGMRDFDKAARKTVVSRIIGNFRRLTLAKPDLAILEDYTRQIIIHASWEPKKGGIINSEADILQEMALRNFHWYREQVRGLLGIKQGENTIRQILYIKYQKTGNTRIAINVAENTVIKRLIMMTMDIYNAKLLESIKCGQKR